MQFIIIGIFVSFFMINICYIVLAHYCYAHFYQNDLFYEAPIFFVLFLEFIKQRRAGLHEFIQKIVSHPQICNQWVYQPVFSASVSASTFLYNLNSLWMETSQNQPQLDISLNFEYKVDMIVSCEHVPNKRCFFLILGQIHHGYSSCYRELLMLAYISPHSCGFVSPQSDL